MPDNLFDNFVGGKLNDHEAPVPDGLWDKLAERQLDAFIGEKLKDHEAAVPETLWDKIADAQLDQHFEENLSHYTAQVPEGVWEKITDGHLDQFFGDKLNPYTAPVPTGLWSRVRDGQLDQFFGEKLGNYTAAVPAGLWEKIHPEEKDRKRVYWWRLPVAASLIFMVLLGGAMGAYFWFRPENKPGTSSVVATPSSTDSKTQTGKPEAIHPALPPVADNTGSEAAGKELSGSNLPAIKKAAGNNKNNVPGSGPVSGSTVSIPGNKSAVGNTIVSNGHQTPFIPSSVTREMSSRDIPMIINAGDSSIHSAAADIPFTLFTPANTIRSGLGRMQLNMHQELTDNHHASQFKSTVICPTDRGMNSDWLLEVYGSPDFAFRSLSNNSATSQYLQKKDSSERMNVGFTAGVRIVKPITNNIWLKTGVQYTQMNERYIYRSENEIKTTTVVTVRTIIRAPGDTVVVSDTSVLQTAGYKNLSVTNRYRSIDIPLTVGYQFGNEGDDIKVGINAGVIFNISSWYQGVILDTALAVVPLTKSNMVYKSKLGLGLYAGLSISKQLGDDMQVFFEPYFRYNLSNMTTAQASYNQKFSLGGLSIGLRFNLNRK